MESEWVKSARENPFKEELLKTASQIASKGKGILAADESVPTIGSRFSSINLKNDEENRLAYRTMLLTTPKIEEFISGVILHEETLNQSISPIITTKTSKEKEKIEIPKYLEQKGILVGIKVDLGTRQLPFFRQGIKYAIGFDTLEKRVPQYYQKGARFAKWRSVLSVSQHSSSEGIINEVAINQVAREQALYASICQANGLVPIVEPELLMDGSHSRNDAQLISEKILSAIYKALSDYNVYLEGTILKPAMIVSGKDNPSRKREGLEERIKKDAKATVECLRRTVPAAVPGITFLSGGQSEEEATLHLNEINKFKGLLPWNVSFSFARALQLKALQVWDGKEGNVEKAQKIFYGRVRRNGEAQKGELEVEWSNVDLGKDLFVENYSY